MSLTNDYVSEDGEYIIPVSWSVYSTITVRAKNLREAVKMARDKINEIPLCSEPEYIDDSYKIDLYTDDDAINAQDFASIGDVTILEDGKIVKN